MKPTYFFIRLTDSVVDRCWNGDDEKGACTHHGFISKQDSPVDIALRWRISVETPQSYIGTFRLNLVELLNAGYIRTDSYRERDGFRVKFVHGKNGRVYLQKNSKSPRLFVGAF